MNVDATTLGILVALVAALVGLLAVVERRHAAASGSSEPAESSHSRATVLGQIVLVAIWFGLGTALVHLTLAFINRYVRDHFLMVSPHIVWLAPIAYVLIFAGAAVVLAVVSTISARVSSFSAVVGVFAWLGLFALLLPFRQVHPAAAAILAAGVATQIARLMARHPAEWGHWMRASALWSSAIVAVIAIGVVGVRAAREQLDESRLSPVTVKRPNVLIIVLDTVRAANLSLYGYRRDTTPELQRLAAVGATFEWAFSTAPWTLKSHGTMFTGLYPHQFEGDFERPIRTPAPMLADVFRDRGYATGGFVANLAYTSYESGLARGFTHYDDYRVTPRQFILHSWIAHTPLFRGVARSRSFGELAAVLREPSLEVEPDDFNDETYARRSAGEINAAFLDWQARHADRPFFAFLNYFDAHIAYRSPPEFQTRFALRERPNLGRYDAAIAYVDFEIGRLLHELRQRGVLDETIVVVTSDHGEQFGEHGLRLHANSLYLPLLHVPLVFAYPPRVATGARVDRPVSLRDVAATIIDLAGLSAEVHVPGRSLASQWDKERGEVSPVVAEVDRFVRPSPDWPVFFGRMQSSADERFHYIRRGDGVEELYAYRTDPGEVENLIATPEGQQRLPRLRAQVSAEHVASTDRHTLPGDHHRANRAAIVAVDTSRRLRTISRDGTRD